MRAFVVVLVASLLAGCFPGTRGASPPQLEVRPSLSPGSPIFLAGTAWVAIPLSYPGEEYEAGGWSSRIPAKSQWTRNCVLHEVTTARTSLVFDHEVADLELFVLEHGQPRLEGEYERPNPARRAVGLLVRAEDQDDLSATADATPDRVYFVKPGVGGTVALTPKKTRLVWWDFDWERDVVLVAFRRDSNEDGAFRKDDAMEVVRYEPLTGQLSPVVDAALLEKAVRISEPSPAR